MISKKTLYLAVLANILLAPTYAFGAVYNIESLGFALLRPLWVIFAIIAVVSFVVAGVLFLTAQGDPSKLKIARSAVIWGVAGIVVGIFAYSAITVIGGLL